MARCQQILSQRSPLGVGSPAAPLRQVPTRVALEEERRVVGTDPKEMLLGILMILGLDLLLIGLVGGIIFVVFTWSVEWPRRRQARRFAKAVARRNFEQAETCAKRAFLTDAVGEQTWTRGIDAHQ
jgi:hypothetical protein